MAGTLAYNHFLLYDFPAICVIADRELLDVGLALTVFVGISYTLSLGHAAAGRIWKMEKFENSKRHFGLCLLFLILHFLVGGEIRTRAQWR